jgi:hypothetical protein
MLRALFDVAKPPLQPERHVDEPLRQQNTRRYDPLQELQRLGGASVLYRRRTSAER